MTVKELIKELTENFEPSDWVRIDGDCLRISSEVCDSLIEIGRAGDEGQLWVTDENGTRGSSYDKEG